MSFCAAATAALHSAANRGRAATAPSAESEAREERAKPRENSEERRVVPAGEREEEEEGHGKGDPIH